ncbi:MAG: prolipoprotein diacylglyceryl transferase [Pseudomonadota bacterium]
MLFAIPFPDIDPALVTFRIGDFALPIRWYALAYIAGLVLGLLYVLAMLRTKRLWAGGAAPLSRAQAEDLLTWMVLGVVIGGRLGFVVFYQPAYYLENPVEVLKVWQGGMAFHGGFLGVIVAIFLFSWRTGANALSVGDLVAAAAPLGICLGRIANFINGELWGRPTTQPWGVIFPEPAAQLCPPEFGEICARHPSQLYQAGMEGLILFLVIAWAVWRGGALRTPGRAIGLFFLGYGIARVIGEGFRMADPQFITRDNPWGHVIPLAGEWGLTMGQTLSLPMVIIGLVILGLSRRRTA